MSIIEKLGITKEVFLIKDQKTALYNPKIIDTAEEMLETLIEDVQKLEFIYVADPNNIDHKIAFKFEAQKKLDIIQKATNKSWDEIKELL